MRIAEKQIQCILITKSKKVSYGRKSICFDCPIYKKCSNIALNLYGANKYLKKEIRNMLE